ncbi:MAG: glycosyltransferase family 2 protein [Lachnospiraceae bacterium]|nr:glycosyltransferase family 2 protein [Lachnospiraceae bacterium]
MNDKILTISVAAYNVEKYIKNTLDSILNTELYSKFEVLVIDDGSTDNTYNVVKKYEEMYPDSFKTIHKENGGYGSTVNYSIKHAVGKYFKLLDGDDWYDTDGLKSLIYELEQTDVDIVFNLFNKIINGKIISGISFDNKYFGREFGIEELDINEGIPMHSVTYKTSVLKESGLMLKERKFYTDNYYVSIPLTRVNTVKFLNFPVYNYRLGLSGQTMNRAVNIKHINDLKEISLDLIDYFSKIDTSCKSYNYLCTRIAATCTDYFAALLTLPISKESLIQIKEFDKFIKIKSSPLYERMANLERKASKTIHMIRKSNYSLYWIFALLRKLI